MGAVFEKCCATCGPPAPKPREIKPLTVREVKRLLKVLEGDYLYAYYVLISTTGIRELALPIFTVGVLRGHRATRPFDSNFVFTTKNGTPFSPYKIIKHFKRKLKMAGLPDDTRIHDLRHSFISWLLGAGVSIKDVQMIVGHAQASTTIEIYTKSMPGYNRKVAEKIEGYVG